ncbi:RagB/SusD family nutrient uptake outer membrane protein [Pedobacter chinensis]|uniref:RagB/SusD family nutrient uptake outer membrane protein n=2 Tax=Pedobacter chinensis TaxID=2282421 RepID=A0A369Q7C7_9SPHI|nr:RagB/SusD family nutrient uptake outer membrane protein [Pedobacter chinensis]
MYLILEFNLAYKFFGMKNRYFIIGTLIAMAAMVSCKKNGLLDPKTEPLSEDKVFADSALTINFLNPIYAATGMDVHPQRNDLVSNAGASDNNASLEEFTTNCRSGYGGLTTFLQGASSPSSGPFFATYAAYYQKIRLANKFMSNLPKAPLSAAKKKTLNAEARFLRAFYYQALVRLYGGIQLMGDDASDEFPTYEYKRNTYKECVDYIASEYDQAAADLPSSLTLDAVDYGRATSGACKALKARLFITAASPLFNGSPVSTNPSVASLVAYSVTYDQNLWQKAADACKAVIDLPEYALVIDHTLPAYPGNGFWKMFVENRKNTEYIFAYNIARGKTIENYWFPWSLTGRGSGTTYSNPSENMVRSFGMRNGKAITDQNSGYVASNPYVNRDPRFYYSIIYDQAQVSDRVSNVMKPVTIQTQRSTNLPIEDGIAQYKTVTGYYNRKMCNDRLPYNSLNVDRAYPIIRLAEIYLGYAEALNETGQVEQAVTWVNKIRDRAGILPGADNRYGIPAGISKESLRDIIRNEYKVELFQEGHFYYDTRRWKTAEQTESEGILGMRVYKEQNGTTNMETFVTLTTIFIAPQMYFVPLPTAEISKSKGLLIQNPGW